jgi:PKD repeat protein
MNTSVLLNISQNDYDRDGIINHSSLNVMSFPSHGTIIEFSEGIVQYTPNTNFNGYDMFTYVIEDDQHISSNVANVTIQVASDDLGEVISQQQTIQERNLPIHSDWWMAQSIRLTGSTITRVELFLKKIGNPSNSIQIEIHRANITGEVVFSSSQPASALNDSYQWINFDSTDFLVNSSERYYIVAHTIQGDSENCYRWGHSLANLYSNGTSLATDNGGGAWNMLNDSDFCFKVFKVGGLEPVSSADEYRITTGHSLVVPSIHGVLANDVDPDQGPHSLIANLEENVSNGILSLQSDGSFIYDPELDFSGVDSFTYRSFDGENYSLMTNVLIRVTSLERYCVQIVESEIPSVNNLFYHNNFFTGTDNQIVSDPYNNFWDNLTVNARGGNYWSLFNEQSEGAYDENEDGFIDLFYQSSDEENVDHFPLANQWYPVGPSANFSWSPFSLFQYQQVNFTDLSYNQGYGTIIEWNWDFDDGIVSAQQSPVHVFNQTGLFNVSLTVVNDEGISDTKIRTVMILPNTPIANFTFNPIHPKIFEPVLFQDLSIHPYGEIVNWSWDFGDGNTSYLQNPVHVFTISDNYSVCLTVEDANGTINSCCKIVTVSSLSEINQSMFDRGFPIRYSIDGNWAGAQSFTSSFSDLIRVEVYLRKYGSVEFNLTIELHEQYPNGLLLDEITFNPEQISTTWNWLEILFSNVTLFPGQEYVIVIPPVPDGVTTSFGYEWGYAFGDQYDDGSFWFTRDGGDVWRKLSPLYDFTFRVFGI